MDKVLTGVDLVVHAYNSRTWEKCHEFERGHPGLYIEY